MPSPSGNPVVFQKYLGDWREVEEYWSALPELLFEEGQFAREMPFGFSEKKHTGWALLVEKMVSFVHKRLPEGKQKREAIPASSVFGVRMIDLIRSWEEPNAEAWQSLVPPGFVATATSSDWSSRDFPHREDQVLAAFRGKVERVEGNVAHVTLIDNHGRQTFAECSAQELADDGMSEGSRFECSVKKRGRETVLILEPASARHVSDEEWKRIHRETAEALAEYDPSDDY